MKKSFKKHASLAQQNGFGPAIFAQFVKAGKKGTAKPNTYC
jgi:hypothetical protein